jgi:hypothetical protein
MNIDSNLYRLNWILTLLLLVSLCCMIGQIVQLKEDLNDIRDTQKVSHSILVSCLDAINEHEERIYTLESAKPTGTLP